MIEKIVKFKKDVALSYILITVYLIVDLFIFQICDQSIKETKLQRCVEIEYFNVRGVQLQLKGNSGTLKEK